MNSVFLKISLGLFLFAGAFCSSSMHRNVPATEDTAAQQIQRLARQPKQNLKRSRFLSPPNRSS